MLEDISTNKAVEVSVELVKDDIFDDFDPDETEFFDNIPIQDQPFDDPDGEPIGDLP